MTGFAAQGQLATTYDSRTNGVPLRSSVVAIDVGNTENLTNPMYEPWMRKYRAPALVHLDNKVGVTITGTVQAARADLRNLIREVFPATDRMTERDARKELKESRDKIGKGNSQGQRLDALEAEVTRLTEILEYLVEQSESFK